MRVGREPLMVLLIEPSCTHFALVVTTPHSNEDTPIVRTNIFIAFTGPLSYSRKDPRYEGDPDYRAAPVQVGLVENYLGGGASLRSIALQAGARHSQPPTPTDKAEPGDIRPTQVPAKQSSRAWARFSLA